MNAEEKKRALEALLQEEGFNFEFIFPNNIAEPVLLIKDYTVRNQRPMSCAFTLKNHYEGNSGDMGRKCWLTCRSVKKINEIGPNEHPDYQEIYHNGVTYFPFSVDLDEWNWNDINSLKDILRVLCAHTNFGENNK